ncbi:MAG TPA: uroporphyrinogen decarboxylase family protein [Clostridia bacterium]|nr:MAG: Uroporphyrinogen decarboxylase (URO-D) [Firmicutes bacterium ADurb.Bin146]HQM40104.1 uroporphyrinogen decarboxylase family protein [Clostridia bacterium]
MEFDRDYDRHNEEVKKVWETYNAKKPLRMPVILGVNNRIILLDSKLNTKGYTFEQYFHDPVILTEVCCECEYQLRHNIYADHDMGMPEEGWTVTSDKQNLYECGWFGAKIVYPNNNVPFSEPFLDEKNKYEFLKKPFPKLFDNFEEQSYNTYNVMLKLQKEGYEYKGKPIKKVNYGSMGTDGPMTLGCMIRGAENFCSDLIEDPQYSNELMDYLVEAAAYRIRGLRKHFGFKEVNDGFGFGDDSIALVSCDMYKEMIFPHHKKLFTLLLEDFDTSINSINSFLYASILS